MYNMFLVCGVVYLGARFFFSFFFYRYYFYSSRTLKRLLFLRKPLEDALKPHRLREPADPGAGVKIRERKQKPDFYNTLCTHHGVKYFPHVHDTNQPVLRNHVVAIRYYPVSYVRFIKIILFSLRPLTLQVSHALKI